MDIFRARRKHLLGLSAPHLRALQKRLRKESHVRENRSDTTRETYDSLYGVERGVKTMLSSSQRILVGLYVGLLILCAALIVVADSLSPSVRAALVPVSADGFKTVLGALLGAMSVILGGRQK
jgi:hypothetical protein